MLVDLARNDVGRVARYGTVSVDELMADRALLARHAHRLERHRDWLGPDETRSTR